MFFFPSFPLFCSPLIVLQICCIYIQGNPHCCAFCNCQHRGLLLSNMISDFCLQLSPTLHSLQDLKGNNIWEATPLLSHGLFHCVSLNAECCQNVSQRNTQSSFGLELTLLNIFICLICLMQLNSAQNLPKATK